MPSAHDDPLLANLLLRNWEEERASGQEAGLDAYLERFRSKESLVAEIWAAVQAGDLDLRLAPPLDPLEARAADWLNSSASAAPERVGRFEILRELGRGGQGVVFLAKDPRLGRHVALKVLTAGRFQHPEARRRFEREAEVASSLQHSGLCPIYETGVVDGAAFLVMPWLEGGPLSMKIRGPVAARGITRWVEIFVAVARALAAAHAAGVVHRDLNPRNILFDKQGQPVIVDFGLARSAASEGSLTQLGDVFGTPPYMAPEQSAGTTDLRDPRVDIFAFGVTFYEVLAGRRPWEAPTLRQILESAAEDEPEDLRRLNPAVSIDLALIIATAMERNPADRYRSADALAEDLDRFLAGKPILARPLPLLTRWVRWCRRNALAASLTSVIFLVLSGALVVSRSAILDRDAALSQTASALRTTEAALEEKADALRRERALRLLTESGQMLQNDPSAAAAALLEAAPLTERQRSWPAAMAVMDAFFERERYGAKKTSRLLSLAADDTGRWLAGGDESGAVILVDRLTATTWMETLHQGWVTDILWVDGANCFFTVGEDAKLIRWKPDTKPEIATTFASGITPVSLAYHAGEARLYIGDAGDGLMSLSPASPSDVRILRAGRPHTRRDLGQRFRQAVLSRRIHIHAETSELIVIADEQATTLSLADSSQSRATIPARRWVFGSGGASLRCVDMTRVVYERSGPTLDLRTDGDRVSDVALLTPDIAAVATTDQITLYEITDGQVSKTRILRGHRGAVTRLHVLPGPLLASAGEDGTLRVWSAQPLSESAEFSGSSDLLDARRGRRLDPSGDSKEISLIDLSTKLVRARIPAPKGGVRAASTRADGKLAILGHRHVMIVDGESGAVVAETTALESEFEDLAWIGAERLVLLSRSTFEIRSSTDFALMKTVPLRDPILRPAIPELIPTPSGKFFVVMAQRPRTFHTMALFTDEGNFVDSWIHGGLERGTSSGLFSSSIDGQMAAYITREKRDDTETRRPSLPVAMVRRMNSTGKPQVLAQSTAAKVVRGVAVSSDGRLAAVAFDFSNATDGDCLEVFDLERRESLWSMAVPGLLGVEFSPDAQTLLLFPTRGDLILVGVLERAELLRRPLPFPRLQQIERSGDDPGFFLIPSRPGRMASSSCRFHLFDPVAALARSLRRIHRN